MNAKPIIALLTIQAIACAPAAFASDVQSLPQVQAVQYVFDCAGPRTLPSQRQVGEWTGQHNVTQIYQTRQKLMAEVARSCNRAGIEQVHLVLEQQAGDQRIEREIAQVGIPRR